MGKRLAKKLWRLKELERILLDAHPRGLHKAELARQIGINRSEIPEYLEDLAAVGVLVYDTDDGNHAIDPATHRVNLRLSLDESLAVLLAVRLLTTRTDKRNPHAAGALRELASAFDKLAPFVARHIRQSANAVDGEHRRDDPLFLRWLERLTQAWAKQVKVRLDYESDEGRFKPHTFAPYFIEPYAVGHTLHVIGWSDSSRKRLTFKVERIRNVELLAETYDLPADFDPTDILRDAWGIWRTEGEPERVVLRFDQRVAYRVRETKWHHLETVDKDEQGNLIWKANISQPREMLPWIRGWGADCEVVEPEWLREELKGEARRLALRYGVVASAQTPVHRLLWAKSDKSGQFHRLLYHLIDVGQVALALWSTALPDGVKRKMAEAVGLGVEEAGRLFAFWASLHDLGKASPAFQDHPYMPKQLRADMRRELQAAGLTFPRRSDEEKRARHEVLTTWTLSPHDENLLTAESGLSEAWAKQVAQALGGHHGTWPTDAKFEPQNLSSDDRGDATWTAVRRELIRELKAVFQPSLPGSDLPPQPQANILFTLFSGLASVADWIGSNEEFFGHEDSGTVPVRLYERYSRALAHMALAQAGWGQPPRTREDFDFTAIFGFEPLDFQSQAIEISREAALPALIILEAPMGSGKTEVALSVKEAWARATGSSGAYIAMPTTATSNQMHERAKKFLKLRYGEEARALLVHSRAELTDDDALTREPETVEEHDLDGDRAGALSWFLPRKRSLLVPFGVGTVDQALMSVLQTKHFFARLLGLSHKVVVFDEVHAYDTYMTALFERLLIWLRQIGASVIVLSATLPEATRRRLVKAYTGRAMPTTRADYPRLTCAPAEGEIAVHELPRSEDKPLALEWLERDEEAIIARLREELKTGGCAAVICNTVKRAQSLYRALLNSEFKELGEDLMLFHARFPQAWRDKIEGKVRVKFGKDRAKGPRPKRAILVATQVIEQSLDLDFDVMVSDLAPADLLLQRAGRLHRHDKDAQGNPISRHHPRRLIVAAPKAVGDVPQFDRADKKVYDAYWLLRSWLALRALPDDTVQLPSDIPILVERVYGEDWKPEIGAKMREALEGAREKMDEDQGGDRAKALRRVVRKPDDDDLLYGDNLSLEEDDPNVHAAFQALTRADRPGISVICLHQREEVLALEPTGEVEAVSADEKPSPEMVRELLKRAVTIRRPDAESRLLEEPASVLARKLLARWKKIPALRYHRVAVFTGGVCRLDGDPTFVLKLDEAIGLEIEEEA